MSNVSRKAFTLVELLIVIAVIAVIATVAILTINPAQLLAQGRDANRISDMSSLSIALADYQSTVRGSMGTSSVIYVSIPDPTATSTAGDQCQGLGFPVLPTGYTYQCAASSTYKNIDGTGWIPVNLNSMTPLPPISVLPIDPVNTSSTGLYYTYATNGNQYEVTSLFESQKYKAQYAQNPIDPMYPEVNAKGSSLSVSPLYNPSGLIGYWPLDEGSGTVAYDQSGNGNNGAWQGTQASPNSTYYGAGKVGSYAGDFDGSTNSITSNNSISWGFNGSIGLWIDPSTAQISTSTWTPFIYLGNFESSLIIRGTDHAPYVQFGNDVAAVGSPLVANSWVYIVATWYYYNSGSSTMSFYQNGNLMESTIGPSPNIVDPLFISPTPFSGLMNDVRIYNRALSPAEIMALYNAER